MAEYAPPIAPLLLGVVVLTVFVVVGWVLPISLGIGCAVRKMYSPHWMWFGIHPVLGWIAFIVLAVLPPRRECPACGGLIQVRFRICPYCRNPIGQMPPHDPAQTQHP